MNKKFSQPAVALLLAGSLCTMFSMEATAQVVSGSSLYYRMGGSSPTGKGVNKNQITMALGLGATLRANYSCGKFDIGLSWSTLMNGLNNLGAQINGAIQSGIAALPLYVLQRAQPGLYQIFQAYSAKADLMVSNSLKTCEEMEAMIKADQNPYEDWVKMAKGETWKTKAQAGGDVVQAKVDINKNEEAQVNGVSWIFQQKAGGVGTAPLRPVRDLSVAGYNVTLNKPTNTNPNTSYIAATERTTRLVQAFATPEDLATFTTQVLGDQQVYLCNGLSNCPASTTATTATGLGPRYDAEVDYVAPKLNVLANGTTQTYGDLNQISAPGMAVTPQLLESLRRMPAENRTVAVSRLSQELAMHRVIDKALVARNVLLTGLSLPEAVAAGTVSKDIQLKVDRLTRYIDDMMFEFRIRKEMTGQTALTIMDDRTQTESQALRQTSPRRQEPQPMENGRVSP